MLEALTLVFNQTKDVHNSSDDTVNGCHHSTAKRNVEPKLLQYHHREKLLLTVSKKRRKIMEDFYGSSENTELQLENKFPREVFSQWCPSRNNSCSRDLETQFIYKKAIC